MRDILEVILIAFVTGLLALAFAGPTIMATRRKKERVVSQIPVQTLYNSALLSHNASFIGWAAKRVYEAWGDNRSYHQLMKHYYTVTGYQFDFSTQKAPPSYDVVASEVGSDMPPLEDETAQEDAE